MLFNPIMIGVIDPNQVKHEIMHIYYYDTKSFFYDLYFQQSPFIFSLLCALVSIQGLFFPG